MLVEGFENVTVKRAEEDLVISWSDEKLGQINIYMADNPDFVETSENLIATVEGGEYKVAVPKDKRVYFILKAENGARIRVAERVMPMDNLTNFRDIGGYLTVDGKRTKWGKLFRSAAHDGITARDVEYLQQLGVKTVVDYRTTAEGADHPDVKVEGVAYHHLCPFDESNATNTLDKKQQQQQRSVEQVKAMMAGINRSLVGDTHCNKTYTGLVQIALDPAQVPVVQHCTSGKDRVGAGAATLLMALGVPRETIMEDYLLSNENQLSAQKMSAGVTSGGQEITPEMMQMFAVLTKVHPEYLEALFDEIDKKWGGTEGYLHDALGLTDADLAKLKDLYLEEM